MTSTDPSNKSFTLYTLSVHLLRLRNIALGLGLLLGGCASISGPVIPEVVTGYKVSAAEAAQAGKDDNTKAAAAAEPGLPTPSLPTLTTGYAIPRSSVVESLSGAAVTIDVESLAIPLFINEVYGDLLGLSFTLAPDLQKKTDKVTLRVTEPQQPAELYSLAQQVLNEYGIELDSSGGLLTFRASARKGKSTEPPLIVSGRALPEVPISHRPIFQLIQLKAVRFVDVSRWLQEVYRGFDIKIIEETRRNGVILVGRQSLVEEAAAAVKALDRPYMRGQFSARIDPRFVDAEQLAKRLVEVLSAEGYGASSQLYDGGTIIILPVAESDLILIFSSDKALVEHSKEWAATLDVPKQGSGRGLYLYSVKNTRASQIAATVDQLLNDSGSPARPGEPPTGAVSSAKSLVVDDAQNAIIFQGEASRWQEILPIIEQLDVPAKQVLVEVTLAEVTLSDQEAFGIEWLAKGSDTTYGEIIDFTPVADGVAGTGITYTVLNSLGSAKLVLNAFATDSRVNLLSTPQLMVQSGEVASIDVGTEIPVVTSNAQSTAAGSEPLLIQEIQYRKTGVILTIEPVVHSGDRVDMVISQEVSEALPTLAGANPSIFNRSIETTLSLKDGNSVLLAGLISSRQTESDSGVPIMKDLPLIGSLFRSKSNNSDKTELVIMIVPYVIENDQAAGVISRALLDRLEFLE